MVSSFSKMKDGQTDRQIEINYQKKEGRGRKEGKSKEGRKQGRKEG